MRRIALLLLALLFLVSCGDKETVPTPPQEPTPAPEVVEPAPVVIVPEKQEVKEEVEKEPEPEPEPEPVTVPEEVPEEAAKTLCTVSVSCEKALSKKENLPQSGIILATTQIEFTEGESVFDVIKRCLEENNIPLEYREDTVFKSIYIEGIGGLFEKDCGAYSGWMYKVNGIPPTCASSEYEVKEGDIIEFYYSC